VPSPRPLSLCVLLAAFAASSIPAQTITGRLKNEAANSPLANYACWEKIRIKFGIKSAEPPVCFNHEEANGSRSESAVAYSVETVLFPRPVTKTIVGPVRCWPVD
jgi:hypothetical protein